jgi:hypothetical protein
MKIQDLLIRMRLPAGSSEERLWNYYDDNGRIFEIRQFGARKFLLGEFKPNGKIVVSSPEGCSTKLSTVVKDALANATPNELCRLLMSKGVEPDNLVREGVEIYLTSFYHDSIDLACQEINDAIGSDIWYSKQVELTAEELKAQENANAFDAVQFWTSCKESLTLAEAQLGLFKGCHTALGPCLSEATKSEILSYLNAPTQQAWLNLRNNTITINTTLWSAWIDFAPTAPRSGSKGYPPAEVLRMTIRSAISNWSEKVDKRLVEVLNRAAKFGQAPARKLEIANGMR